MRTPIVARKLFMAPEENDSFNGAKTFQEGPCEQVIWPYNSPLKQDETVDWLYEDQETEFKMHTSVSIEEVSKYSEMVHQEKVVRTLQPLSKTICAFLNTKGGKVYLGVKNDGVIKGILMNDYLMEHLINSLDDTVSRFKPRPPADAIKVEIFPINEDSTDVAKNQHDKVAEQEDDGWGGKFKGKELKLKEPKTIYHDTKAIHYLRGGRCPPCHSSIQAGGKHVVIIIHVKKSSGPIYSNEEGLTYQRTWVGNRLLTIDKLRQRYQAALGDQGFEDIDQALAHNGPVMSHYR